MHKRFREGVFMLTLAFCLYMLLSLASYHATDPSWSNTGQGGGILNAGGAVGAWFADVLLYLCGYLAFIFPLLFSYFAWQYAKISETTESLPTLFYLKAMGFLLFLFAGVGILSLHFKPGPHVPFTAGVFLATLLVIACIKFSILWAPDSFYLLSC